VIPNKYAEWNNEPAVPGAEPKDKQATPTPSSSERHQRPSPHLAPQLAINHDYSRPERAPVIHNTDEEKKKSGMGTVLLGLVLYFATRGSDKPKAVR
jgi:membrane protein